MLSIFWKPGSSSSCRHSGKKWSGYGLAYSNANDTKKKGEAAQRSKAGIGSWTTIILMMDARYAENTKYQKKRGDMGKAIKDMLDESRAETLTEVLTELVQEGSLSIEKAATKANMTVEQFKRIMEEHSYKEIIAEDGATTSVIEKPNI